MNLEQLFILIGYVKVLHTLDLSRELAYIKFNSFIGFNGFADSIELREAP